MRAAFLVATTLTSGALACTTIVAGKLATADGSVMVSHSNDGEGASDPRLVRIPAATHKAGTMRPIFFAPENYPRYVGAARGAVPAYVPVGNQTAFVPIGHIPEVESTYSYFEETYGCLNEKQLGIGESTCSGVFGTKPASHLRTSPATSWSWKVPTRSRSDARPWLTCSVACSFRTQCVTAVARASAMSPRMV